MNPKTEHEVTMHKDFFDRTKYAIENGYYLEAVFMEYASIEARLEVILGLIGAPCNKNSSPEYRKDICISHRIACLSKAYNLSSQLGNTKLDKQFFTELKVWCKKRNTITHGLFKNSIKYKERSASLKELAEYGETITRMLYNEAKRLRRYRNSHPDNCLSSIAECVIKGCKLYKQYNGEDLQEVKQ